jgi:hypothetical protein
MMTIYALWNACFNNDQRVLIVANKEGTAIEIFQRIRLAYEELPNWLKPGVKEYGKTSMVLANGSRVGISTTTGTAARGQSVNCLILDELAFIEPNLVEPFWNSVYPIISSSKKSKIFIASTPNGTENLFYRLYSGAVAKENGWSPERIDWWEVPGRDDRWKNETVRTIGSEEVFRQEFGNEFLETGESILNEDLLEKLFINNTSPLHLLDDGNYKIWTTPDSSRTYVVGVDVGEGVDQAASCAQILDITDLTHIEQVAIYHSNNISPYNFTAKLLDILQHWGSPLALIERNNCGAQVVDSLKNQHNYEHIVTYMPNMKKLDPNRAGVLAHTNTKYKGVMNMRYWVNELNAVVIRDVDTVNEIKNFIRMPNGTWRARDGKDIWDDRVMSLIWALMILEQTLTERYFEITQYDDNGKPLIIKSLYDDFNFTNNPLPVYDELHNTNTLPALIGNSSENDIDDLVSAGWSFLKD